MPALLPIDLADLAQRHGDSVALLDRERTITFNELARLVATRAGAIPPSFAEPGQRVLLACESNIETAILALAMLTKDITLIPIQGGIPADDLERTAAATRAVGIAAADNHRTFTNPHAHQQPSGPVPCLALLSSGSTGMPKIVLRSREQVAHALRIYADSVQLKSSDRVMALVPLEHSYGFNNVLLASLSVGAAVVFPGTNHPRAAALAAGEMGVTVFPGAPVFFELMSKFANAAAMDAVRGVRAFITVGTALATDIHARFLEIFGRGLWQSYGTSEAGPVALNRDGTTDGPVLALGEICPGVAVSIQDDTGQPAADGVIGEVVIDSPAVATGYDAPSDSSRIEAGRFFSGDLGCMQGGKLYFRGRSKLLIAAAGHKVDPQEVETTLLSHPAVGDCVVIGVRLDASREEVKAIVVPRGTVTAMDLTVFLSERLATFKVPRMFEFRESLPRNAMGKIQREQLDA